MYQHNSAPLAMGVGGGSLLSIFELPWFWAILAAFAICAAWCAVKRSIPKVWIITNNEDLDAETINMADVRRHARL